MEKPDGSYVGGIDMSGYLEDLKQKSVFEKYAEKIAYYQRFIKPDISDDMAKSILDVCAAMIYNLNATDDINEYTESVAEKRGVDTEEFMKEFEDFMEFAPPSQVVNELWGDD